MRAHWPFGKLLLAAILTLQIACDDTPVFVGDQDPENELYVLAVLSPLMPAQEILIEHVRPFGFNRPVTDATVSIRRGDIRYSFEHIGDGRYSDVHERLPVLQGATYYLKIDIPGVAPISASTTVPHGFRILSPIPEDTLTLTSSYLRSVYDGRMVVALQGGVNGWLTRVQPTLAMPPIRGSNWGGCLVIGDTSYQRISYSKEVGPPPARFSLLASQSDSMFSIYTILNAPTCFEFATDIRAERAFTLAVNRWRRNHRNQYFNIVNARGVFGSLAIDSVSVPVKLKVSHE